jgi:OOP family OmpA-OmpF porin
MNYALKQLAFLAAMTMVTLSGCANYELNTKRGDIPGYYIRTEMQDADRAVETARNAGKDKICPVEFKAAEDAKNNAYDVYRACHTEEGAALAKQATAKANALCPPQAVAPAPAPMPVPMPAPMPTPTSKLSITPDLITRGQSAKMSWTSQNATDCDIQPGVGSVRPQGSMTITPADNTAYTLVCRGAGGTADSTANISVAAPTPAAAPVIVPSPPAPVEKMCSPTVINIKFDTNKADIKPQYHDELKKLADFLIEFPNAKGVIEGHTDSDGDKASNMRLSQRRADSVRNYIIKNFGLAPERFSAKGFGPTRPVADNKTKEGKQRNRRIEANFDCGQVVISK